MAYRHHLVSAPPQKLAAIAEYVVGLAGNEDGDPYIPVGSRRLVLTPVAVSCLREAHPAGSLREALEAKGAQTVDPVTPDRVRELVNAREPSELSVPRGTRGDEELVVDGYDWHLQVSRLVEAWELVGRPGRIDWGDVRVGQIDTGFRAHPALGWRGGRASDFVLTDVDRNFFSGDFEEDEWLARPATGELDSALDPMKGAAADGHGTRTGSVLAGFDETARAKERGRFKGFYGAAPKVPYIPVRVCDSVIINHQQNALAQAIDHLVWHGCQVITLSMGIALPALLTGRAARSLDYAYEMGVILVCAAGNVIDPVVSPARNHRTIAVAGCTPRRKPWNGSSFGPEVDIAAPAWPVRRGSVDRKGDPSYGPGGGTSYATPQVAGTAALWLRHRWDDIRHAYPRRWQRVEAFKQVLISTARPGADWNSELYGEGILDARAVLEAGLPDAGTLSKDEANA